MIGIGRRLALRTAQDLDARVDAELANLRRLPMPLRAGPAASLAVLVMLAQSHRYYAARWIRDRELRRRIDAALVELDEVPLRVIEEHLGNGN